MLAALLITGCGGSTAGPSVPASQDGLAHTVKIALVSAFSGPNAGIGRKAENGLRVEVDRLNARGGLLGQRVEVVTADDESDAEKAHELVRELLQDSRVRLLVGPSSGAGFQAAAPLIGQSATPQCVTAVPDVAMAGAKFSFRVAPYQGDRLASLFSYLRQAHPKTGRVGFLDGGQVPAEADEGQLRLQAAGHGLGYAGRASIGQSDSEAAAAAQLLLSQGARAVVVGGSPAAAARAAAAVTAAAASGQGQLLLLGLDGLSDYSFPSAAGGAADGSIFAGTLQANLTDQLEASWPAGYRAFVREVTRAYGYGRDGVEIQGSPAFADCVLQWSLAVARARSFSGGAVAEAWEKLELPAAETALGVPEKASPSNHTTVPARAVFVYGWVRSGAAHQLRLLAGP